MPRYGRVPKRKIAADPVYGSELVSRFVNKMLAAGKKSKAENILYLALEEVKKKSGKDPMEVFQKAIENASPVVQVKSRRVGGATYQIPYETTRERRTALAMQWLRNFSRERGGKSMVENLAAELLDAYNGAGGAVKKKEDVHKVAEANKAFAHFRW